MMKEFDRVSVSIYIIRSDREDGREQQSPAVCRDEYPPGIEEISLPIPVIFLD